MPLVFCGACSHAPGITSRPEKADPAARTEVFAAFARLREAIHAARPDALVIVAAEHFANFFMNNMPAFAIGMAEHYDGPIEKAAWLGVPPRRVPGNKDLSKRLVRAVMQDVDVAYAEEWRLDHGIMVPLHLLSPDNDLVLIPANINCQGPPLTPLHRAYAFGQALRRAADAVPERIALLGTGGISHWPATPNSGKINAEWDARFMARWAANDREALLSYSDEDTYREAGQGGFEIRTFIAAAGAAEGSTGEVWCSIPVPAFAVSATVAVMKL
jgi:2,3-dihydroxyphenylpropionate 1,2-dioxygenase